MALFPFVTVLYKAFPVFPVCLLILVPLISSNTTISLYPLAATRSSTIYLLLFSA
jgi:hypothetical protein